MCKLYAETKCRYKVEKDKKHAKMLEKIRKIHGLSPVSHKRTPFAAGSGKWGRFRLEVLGISDFRRQGKVYARKSFFLSFSIKPATAFAAFSSLTSYSASRA